MHIPYNLELPLYEVYYKNLNTGTQAHKFCPQCNWNIICNSEKGGEMVKFFK